MDTEQIRLCFLEVLKNLDSSRTNQYGSTLHHQIAQRAVEHGFMTEQQDGSGRFRLPREDEPKAREVFWSFIIQGLIIPGSNDSNPSLPFFALTDYGRAVVESQQPIPHDPDRYMEHIRSIAPNLDAIALSYLGEALECFQRGTFTASIILLGVVSEKIILDLANIVQQNLSGKNADNLLKIIKNSGIARIHTEMRKRLSPYISQFPDSLSDGLEGYLGGIFQIIRTHRNQAGHPSGSMIDRMTALGLFYSFPFYCQRVSELTEYIRENGFTTIPTSNHP